MCGISVVINGTRPEVYLMGKAIQHRGTHHSLTEIDNIRVYFSHLKITDSSSQDQPFCSGKWMVWMNGYISNYWEIAHKYKINLDSGCDTELLSRFIEKFGMDNWGELNGFFSIFAYDTIEKKMLAGTDRYGIKQLYRYVSPGGTVYISSEPKAILKVNPQIGINVDYENEWIYSLGVMNPHTIYRDIKRVPCIASPKITPLSISYSDAKDQLTYLLSQSMFRNKVKAIKDGVFLSGGIDSGLLANRLDPDYCFSMDYHDEKYSEINNIKLNSNSKHITMICNRDLFDEYKVKTFQAVDDLKVGSCYTNFALTEVASKFCTVLYSGAGGDEVFDGYIHRYDRKINDVIRRTLITDDFNEQVFYDDITHKQYDWQYLKGILVIEDRMSGYHTMETRYPYLDNDLVNFVLSLPEEYRKDKRILRDVCGLAPEVARGRKRGFSNPYMTNFQWAKFALEQVKTHLSKERTQGT